MSRLLADEDVFSALDNVLERITNLQQLVSTWAENLSEDDCHGDSSSSSSSQDSPTDGSSATSPCHIRLDVQHPGETEEEEEAVNQELNGKKKTTRWEKVLIQEMKTESVLCEDH